MKKHEIKWKTYGSKKFIPYIIKDDFIFLAVGMAEFIILEAMNVSYILLQSDGMFHHISDDIIAKAQGRNIIILNERDSSFGNLILKLQGIFVNSNIFLIDFEEILNRSLKKGYDFRDFCNEIGNIVEVEILLEEQIIKQVKEYFQLTYH